jgi:hypothetical protein
LEARWRTDYELGSASTSAQPVAERAQLRQLIGLELTFLRVQRHAAARNATALS